MAKIRVLIADDQDLFASGLEIILKTQGKDDVQVLSTARDGKEAVQKAEKLAPDVILMDVRMPVMDGVEATRVIREKHPSIKILILTTFDDDQYVHDALAYGANGYVLKNIKPENLITSIKAVAMGNLFVSPSVGDRLVRQVSEGALRNVRRSISYQGEINFLLATFESLRPREAEILHLLLQDYDNREIGERLFIAEQTVKNYVSLIYGKLGVDDRNHAKQLVKDIIAGERNALSDGDRASSPGS
jgi:DNA-binding NarL/FixJ family response regulator